MSETFKRLIELVSKTMAYICIALGVVVMLGWLVGSSTLVQVIPTYAPMQFNTALCCFLSGLSLWALQRELPFTQMWTGALVFLIGGVTLVQYGMDWNIGIDQLFIQHHITTKTSHVGRMSPNTATACVCNGLALLCALRFPSRAFRLLAQVGASSAFSLSCVTFFGYLFAWEQLYGWGDLTRMAIHTALGFVAASLGILAYIWYADPMVQRRPIRGLFVPVGFSMGLVSVVLALAMQATYSQTESNLPWVALGIGWGGAGLTMVLLYVTQLLYEKRWELSQSHAALEQRVEARTAALREANEELQRANRELEQFAYVASHDLQEPLRMVHSYVQLLEEDYAGQLDEDAREYIAYAVDGARRMKRLIDDLLAYSRLQRGPGKFTHVALGQVVEQVCKNLMMPMDQLELPSEGLPSVWGNAFQLERLFQNLLGNAVKYCETTPHVTISVEQDETHWRFAITDNGIGIPARFLEKIFQLFQRLHSREQYQGTGMGLALCRRIVEHHGGEISATSVEGEGSTFSFSLARRHEAKA